MRWLGQSHCRSRRKRKLMTAMKENIEPATVPQWERSLCSRAGRGRTGCLHARSYTYRHRNVYIVYIVWLLWYNVWLRCTHLFCSLSNVSPGVQTLDLAVDGGRRGHFTCTLPGDDFFQAKTEWADCWLTQGHQLIRKNLWYASNPSAYHLNTYKKRRKKQTNLPLK